MHLDDVGAVAVLDLVKRERSSATGDDVEVYSAKKLRPDFTSSDRDELQQILNSASVTLYGPQRAVIVRTSQDIARFRKDLETVHKKDITKEKYRQKIADLELLISEKEAEHDQALWEIQQDVQQAKQRAQLQVANIAHQAQQRVEAVSHQAQQQVAAASHQAQLQQAQLVQEGTMIIMDKDRQIGELQRSTAAEIQTLRHDKGALERQVSYMASITDQLKQQNASESQRLNNVIVELNSQLQDAQTKSQRRLDDLSNQMASLSSTHSATVDSNMEEKRLQQQALLEKESLVHSLQAQLFDSQHRANLELSRFNDEATRRATALAETEHRLQQSDALAAQLKSHHEMELAHLQNAGARQQAEIQRLQAQLQAASRPAAGAAVHNVRASRTPVAEPVQPLVKGLTELVSHQHKLAIPYFSGYLHEPPVEEWLKEAERVARTAGWDGEMKIRFFGDRLRHMALAHHEDLLSKWVAPNFAQWKTAMLERFQDKSAADTYKRALELLQQKPTQRVQDFGSQIDEVYKKAYGASAAVSTDPDVTAIREDIKKRVLYKGLREIISNQMWVSPSANYQQHLQKAIDVDEMLNRKNALTIQPAVPTVATMAGADDKLKAIIDKLNKMKINERTPIPQDRPKFTSKPRARAGLPTRVQTNLRRTQTDRSAVPAKRLDVVCFKCKKKGHYSRECRSPPATEVK